MTNPKFTPVVCCACFKTVGKIPGVAASPSNVYCDDPVCAYQGPADINDDRDDQIMALVQARVSPSAIAAEFGITRQRVYQIFDKWKQGV